MSIKDRQHLETPLFHVALLPSLLDQLQAARHHKVSLQVVEDAKIKNKKYPCNLIGNFFPRGKLNFEERCPDCGCEPCGVHAEV